jgi:hypothetical protein
VGHALPPFSAPKTAGGLAGADRFITPRGARPGIFRNPGALADTHLGLKPLMLAKLDTYYGWLAVLLTLFRARFQAGAAA